MQQADAETVVGWRYSSTYPGMDFSDADLPVLLDPANFVHVVESEGQSEAGADPEWRLDGMFGVGPFARPAEAALLPGVVDIGFARAPDRVGRGEGGRFLAAILAFLHATGKAVTARATVAELNVACCRLLTSAKFQYVQRNWQSHGLTTITFTRRIEPEQPR